MAAGEITRVLARSDGQQLRAAVETAAAWLHAHAHEVDALNVFPVPDGDTGANMSQTLRAAAWEAARDEGQGHDAGQYAARLAHGALMAARGNSGVILSQLLRGFARALDGQRTFTAVDLARGLREASDMAYRAVVKPVEGTVLTVARVAAEQATAAAAERPDLLHVLSAALSASRRALAETRTQLPALRQAGVVDAGGRGYVLILEGVLRHLQGKPGMLEDEPESQAAPSRAGVAGHARFAHMESGHGYCTEFMVAGQNLDEAAVRDALSAIGDSLLVVGEPDLLRVHLHTEDPGRALSFAGNLGRLRLVKVQDMQEQHEAFAAEAGAAEPAPAPDQALPVGVVAVASGPGFARVFASLGALVVPGGQTMNPSTEQLLAGIEGCRQDSVIVLPNNRNVVLSAQQAASLSAKTVHVLPTETMPQGIAALLAVSYDEETEQILATMRAAAAQIRTAELTTAVRDVQIDGLAIHTGAILGLLDGKVVAVGEDSGSVATDLLDRMPLDRYEVVTIYPGQNATPEASEALAALLRRRYPELHVEQVDGGQPHYQFVLSVE